MLKAVTLEATTLKLRKHSKVVLPSTFWIINNFFHKLIWAVIVM
jgi:hypothetical protein